MSLTTKIRGNVQILDGSIDLSQLSASAIAALQNGPNWQDAVLSATILTPPVSPVLGDRYLINGTGTGAWVGHNNNIAQWNGTTWIFTTCPTGAYVSSDAETDGIYYFGGINWTKKFWENTTAGAGLTKTGAQISAVAGAGIAVNGGISVNFFKERFPAISTATVTLARIPAVGSTLAFYNGQQLDEGVGNDYTVSSNIITLLFTPQGGTDKIVVWYLV
jgi:hypothetical protein